MKKIMNLLMLVSLVCLGGMALLAFMESNKDFKESLYVEEKYEYGDGFFGNERLDAMVEKYHYMFPYHRFRDVDGTVFGEVGGEVDGNTFSTNEKRILVSFSFPSFQQLNDPIKYENELFGYGFSEDGLKRETMIYAEEFLQTISKYGDQVNIDFSRRSSNNNSYFGISFSVQDFENNEWTTILRSYDLYKQTYSKYLSLSDIALIESHLK